MEGPGVIKFYSNKTDYGYLSNFYPSPFEVDKIKYKTSEHYFQAKKTDASDPIFQQIIDAENPKTAKSLGSKCNLRKDWEEVKDKVMEEALIEKFKQNPALKEQLLKTGTAKLIEAAPSDYYWGQGKSGSGKNKLGLILMKVRDMLK
jgi:N-glycosidase YbiA